MKKRHTSLSNLKLIDDRTAVFAFLAFLVVILFMFDAFADQQSLFGSRTTKTSAQNGTVVLTQELADQVVSKLTVDSREDDGVAFIVKDTVDPQLLAYFANMDYETVKAHLGLQSDFVIHFEDDNGDVIPMGDRLCIGSKSATLNGVPCG